MFFRNNRRLRTGGKVPSWYPEPQKSININKETIKEIKKMELENNKRPLGYLGGDIMTHGSNLARQEEYNKFVENKLPVDIYSPVMNKSINDKSSMTEEQNNCLAEKIVAADVERLWNSDFTVLCPEQSAIGTMCEMGILYGWKYMTDRILDIVAPYADGEKEWSDWKILREILEVVIDQNHKQNFAHYSDIRTNHLNEKDWRRSFSINQFLYGIILAATADGKLNDNFDEILPKLKELYGEKNN